MKIWLDVNSGDFEDFLSELNDIKGTSVWTLKHIVKSGYPKVYMPLYIDGHLIANPEKDILARGSASSKQYDWRQ